MKSNKTLIYKLDVNDFFSNDYSQFNKKKLIMVMRKTSERDIFDHPF